MLRKMATGLLAAALILVGLSCQPPVQPPSNVIPPGSFQITAQAPADFPAGFTFETITIVSSLDGYSPVSHDLTSLGQPVLFDKIKTGQWNVTVSGKARNAAGQLEEIISGQTGVDVSANLSEIVIPVSQVKVTPIQASLNGGTVPVGQNLQLSSLTPNVTIRYTLDGSEPTASSPAAGGNGASSITLATAGQIQVKAKAFGLDLQPSSTLTLNFTVTGTSTQAASPSITQVGTSDVVNITAAAGASIYYTTNPSAALSAYLAYTGPLTVPAGSTTLLAFARENGKQDSMVVSRTITYTPIIIVDQVGAVSATAAGATLSSGANVLDTDSLTLLTATAGAQIYYTTDGSDPKTSANQAYTAAFKLAAGTYTLKAFARKSGMTDSATLSLALTVKSANPIGTVSTPVIVPSASSILTTDTVSLSSDTGATIYYTVNGTTPTTASTVYSAPFTLTAGSVTVKALATKTGLNNSAVASKTFTVTTPAVATSVSLTVDKATVEPGASATFTASVLDQNGNAMAGQTVDLYLGSVKQTSWTYSTTVEGTYTFTAKSGSLTSNAVALTVKKSTIVPNAHYSTNPNGQVGKYKAGMNVTCAATLSDGFTDWDSSMLIAQGVAGDDAKSFRGGHEYPSYDSYALYAAWDDTNLYLGWQFVYVNDVINPSNNGANEARPTNGDIPQMLVFDTDPAKASIGTMKTGKNLWYDSQAAAGFNFDLSLGVDKIAMFSSKGGVGSPALFNMGADGFFNYTDLNLFSKLGIVYGAVYGQNPGISTVMGIKKYPYEPADLNAEVGWVDMNTAGHVKTIDTFYEMKIPLAALGITRAELESRGIGIMHISIYGVSGVDSLPADKAATLDNALLPYSQDASTSKEKEDTDKFTVPLARIGHL